MSTISFWNDEQKPATYQPLNLSLTADVCVIGGGIAGITTGYLLASKGLRVILLEAYELLSGQTGQTTAHFSSALDDRYFNMINKHGVDKSKLIYKSHQAAIEWVDQTAELEGIECDLERLNGYLFKHPNSPLNVIEDELKAVEKLGLTHVHLQDGMLCFPNQMRLHPNKYLNGLANAFVRKGGKIFTNSRVTKIEENNPIEVQTSNGCAVTAKSLVVATNSPINNVFTIHTKQAPYRSYVLGFESPKGRFPQALFWDTGDPYHYIRSQELSGDINSELVIVGGEDHKTGQDDIPQSRFKNLETWARERYPYLGRVIYEWSGQVMESVDGLGFLGRNPGSENVYIITGDSGMGMTHATIGAQIISDQITGFKNAYERLYSAARINFSSTTEFLKENINVAAQYLDWIHPGERPVCTHLGGIMHWNDVEKTWDCPCHGSRFSTEGRVIEGPAISDIKKESISP